MHPVTKKNIYLKHHPHLAQCKGRVEGLPDKPPVVATFYGKQASIPHDIIFRGSLVPQKTTKASISKVVKILD